MSDNKKIIDVTEDEIKLIEQYDEQVQEVLPQEDDLNELIFIKKEELPSVSDQDNTETIHPVAVNETKTDNIFEEDFKKTRNNLSKILEKAESWVEDIGLIAEGCGLPEAYDSLNSFLKTYAQLNKELLNTHLVQKKIQEEKNKEDTKTENVKEKNVTNNNIFVGSTAELAKVMKKMNNDTDNNPEK